MKRGAVTTEVGCALGGVRCFVMARAENVVGVHVRHGDKKTESAIIPIEDYLEAAKVRDVTQADCCINR